MNSTTALHPSRPAPPARRAPITPAVVVLVCGSPDRGDDGAALAAAEILRRGFEPDVALRLIGQLDVDDLLAIDQGTGVVIVDAATGISPGTVLEIPLRGLLGDAVAARPRSSHALEMPEVIGVAEMIRGRPLIGRIVVVGARSFRLGHRLSTPVAAALPALARAVEAAVASVRAALADGDGEPVLRRAR